MNVGISFLFTVYALLLSLVVPFAMMWSNIQSINKMMDEPPKPRHPEAPKEGDEVMYVDMTRETIGKTLQRRQKMIYKGRSNRPLMKIFLDTADTDVIRKIFFHGIS